MDAELRALLHGLPTRANIESLIGRLEEQHRKALQEVKQDLQSLTTRMTMGESSLVAMEQRVTSLESLQDAHMDAAITLQLHMEDMEDRSRCNNLWLWGLPEATGPEDLAASALEIFLRLSDDPFPANLELDQIHRVLSPPTAGCGMQSPPFHPQGKHHL